MTHRRLGNSGGTTATATAQVSPSIVVIIIVLTVIFFLSAFLHLLIRWLARNPALIRRGARTGTNGRTGSNNRIIALTALQGQLQQLFSIQDAGLDRSLIEELPVFSYKAAMGALKEGADCAICLCEFVGEDQLRLLPSCGHAFHTDCIDTWLLSHSTCPLCRTLLLPECWLPGSLQPLLSSEMSTVGDTEHQQAVQDHAVPTQSGRFTSSTRSSSLGRITIVAGSTGAAAHAEQTQYSQLPVEPHFSGLNENSSSNLAELGESGLAIPAMDPSRVSMSSSVGMWPTISSHHEQSQESSDLHKCAASSEVEHGMINANKMSSSEATSSAFLNPMIGSTSAGQVLDSGHLSYTSLGNNTEVQSGRYSDQLERASVYGSGRRVSVHLGKCRVVNEQGKSSRKSKAGGGASRRSYSKGSYEYVIDSSTNLEVLIPSQSKPPASVSGSQLNDLLNLSHRISNSLAADAEMPASGPRDFTGKSPSPSWASASFRKLRLCNGGIDSDVSSEEAINAPLNTLQPSDKPVKCDHWQAADINAMPPDHGELSTATSMRGNVGSDASFSPDSVAQKLQELSTMGRSYESGRDNFKPESSQRAVSFRLPTATSHHVLIAKVRASASRRALSESEALSYWEPCRSTTDQDCNMQLENGSDDRMLILDNERTGSGHRSSSFAKRMIDWLVGWPRRMVHPEKTAPNSG